MSIYGLHKCSELLFQQSQRGGVIQSYHERKAVSIFYCQEDVDFHTHSARFGVGLQFNIPS